MALIAIDRRVTLNRLLTVSALLVGLACLVFLSETALPLTSTAFILLLAVVGAVVIRELHKPEVDVFNPIFFMSFLFFYYFLMAIFDRPENS